MHIHEKWNAIRMQNGRSETFSDTIATELPLTIVVNGEEFATIVCSPVHLDELVIGFLASEGIIRLKSEVASLHADEKRGFAYVELTKKFDQIEQDHSKRFIGSCCGKSRQFYFKSDVQTARTVQHDLEIDAKQCLHLIDLLHERSTFFKQTGGVHNAALCTKDSLLEVRTDIGRHNALDKLYGYMLNNKIKRDDKVIAFSGRISSEVLLKISKMNIAILISTSAPTSLALQLADDLNITTIGFARNERMNVYTHASRIKEVDDSVQIGM